jgi:hypothetical protein
MHAWGGCPSLFERDCGSALGVKKTPEYTVLLSYKCIRVLRSNTRRPPTPVYSACLRGLDPHLPLLPTAFPLIVIQILALALTVVRVSLQ